MFDLGMHRPSSAASDRSKFYRLIGGLAVRRDLQRRTDIATRLFIAENSGVRKAFEDMKRRCARAIRWKRFVLQSDPRSV